MSQPPTRRFETTDQIVWVTAGLTGRNASNEYTELKLNAAKTELANADKRLGAKKGGINAAPYKGQIDGGKSNSPRGTKPPGIRTQNAHVRRLQASQARQGIQSLRESCRQKRRGGKSDAHHIRECQVCDKPALDQEMQEAVLGIYVRRGKAVSVLCKLCGDRLGDAGKRPIPREGRKVLP